MIALPPPSNKSISSQLVKNGIERVGGEKNYYSGISRFERQFGMNDKSVKITIIRDGEDVEVKIGKKSIITANHDEHGWAGIDLVETMAKNIGKALDISVVEK